MIGSLNPELQKRLDEFFEDIDIDDRLVLSTVPEAAGRVGRILDGRIHALGEGAIMDVTSNVQTQSPHPLEPEIQRVSGGTLTDPKSDLRVRVVQTTKTVLAGESAVEVEDTNLVFIRESKAAAELVSLRIHTLPGQRGRYEGHVHHWSGTEGLSVEDSFSFEELPEINLTMLKGASVALRSLEDGDLVI